MKAIAEISLRDSVARDVDDDGEVFVLEEAQCEFARNICELSVP